MRQTSFCMTAWSMNPYWSWPGDAEQISVGKIPGEDHNATQARIHALMLERAQQGQLVVRLKGGDAFVFGRGGEELEFLRKHQVPYEVVPGITEALDCAAHAGIPLTHRAHAQYVQSEERLAGYEGVSRCSFWWSPFTSTKKKKSS